MIYKSSSSHWKHMFLVFYEVFNILPAHRSLYNPLSFYKVKSNISQCVSDFSNCVTPFLFPFFSVTLRKFVNLIDVFMGTILSFADFSLLYFIFFINLIITLTFSFLLSYFIFFMSPKC